MDIGELAAQVFGIFKSSCEAVYDAFTEEDRRRLEEYSRNIAQCMIERATTNDPAQIQRLDTDIAGFGTSIRLLADKHLLNADHASRQAITRAIGVVVEWLKDVIGATAHIIRDQAGARAPH